jgi:HAD superfamily hydrolase (TIGR01450 family)
MNKFLELLPQYKAVFLDSYGVLKNHRGVIEGVRSVIEEIRDRGLPLRVLTNDASRSQKMQAQGFSEIGLDNILAEEIITSGMMARQYLELKNPKGLIAYLGTDQAAKYILEVGLKTIAVNKINADNITEIQAMVFLDDEGFDWNNDINHTLNLLRHRNIPAIVANSDAIYPVSKNDVSIATGSIAKLVENVLGREFIHFGKPDSQMFMYAYEHVNQNHNIRRSDILMVGDTLHTDILGGNKFGLGTALVLSGNTRSENFDLKIRTTGIIPDHICNSITE